MPRSNLHKVNQESTPRCDKKWLSKLYQNPNQQMIEKNQTNKWLIPKHINTWSVISKGIKSTQQMIDKTPIENKIPIKTKNIN